MVAALRGMVARALHSRPVTCGTGETDGPQAIWWGHPVGELGKHGHATFETVFSKLIGFWDHRYSVICLKYSVITKILFMLHRN